MYQTVPRYQPRIYALAGSCPTCPEHAVPSLHATLCGFGPRHAREALVSVEDGNIMHATTNILRHVLIWKSIVVPNYRRILLPWIVQFILGLARWFTRVRST